MRQDDVPYTELDIHNIEWAVWAARKMRGKSRDVAVRILDQNPELRMSGGTTTRCPIEGVHEHPFRGPHRFHEWEPGK